jgi:hypothetical protein
VCFLYVCLFGAAGTPVFAQCPGGVFPVGHDLVCAGTVALARDERRKCFVSKFKKGEELTEDYFTCVTCNCNWICQVTWLLLRAREWGGPLLWLCVCVHARACVRDGSRTCVCSAWPSWEYAGEGVCACGNAGCWEHAATCLPAAPPPSRICVGFGQRRWCPPPPLPRAGRHVWSTATRDTQRAPTSRATSPATRAATASRKSCVR